MEQISKLAILATSKLPRFSIVRVDCNPIFDPTNERYIQGVVFWSLLSLICLVFWLCMIVSFNCLWCCLQSRLSIIEQSKSAAFYRRLTSIGAWVLFLLNCFATILLVFGSERLHSEQKQLINNLDPVVKNLSYINYTSSNLKYRLTELNEKDRVRPEDLDAVSRHQLFQFFNRSATLMIRSRNVVNRVETIRWLCIIVFASIFSFICLSLCGCCKTSPSKRFMLVSLMLVPLLIFVNVMFSFFYLPSTIMLSDMCRDPALTVKTWFSTIGNDNPYAKDNRENADLLSNIYNRQFAAVEEEVQKMRDILQRLASGAGDNGKGKLFRSCAREMDSALANQFEVEKLSEHLRNTTHTLCDQALSMMTICVLALSILSATLGAGSLLFNCLSHHFEKPRPLPRVAPHRRNTFRDVFCRRRPPCSSIRPSAPLLSDVVDAWSDRPTSAAVKNQRRRRSNRNRNVELSPMIPHLVPSPSQNNTPPPSYEDASDVIGNDRLPSNEPQQAERNRRAL